MMNTGEVVLVTMNYRLGALGYLSTGDEVVPGNNGMKDQVLALRWVKQNIAQFGGNPHNVTIGGISAGGGSVHLHILSPMSEGLFHRAIAQSGSALCPWAAEDPAVARTKAFRLGKVLGCNTSDSKELVEFLMTVPAQQLTEATDKALTKNEKHPLPILFHPVIELEKHEDEVFLPDRPIDLIRNGKFHKVPLIIGVTSKEGKLILPDLLEHTSWYNFLNNNWEPLLTVQLKLPKGTEKIKEISRKIQEFYFGDKAVSKETWSQLLDVYGDILFNTGAYRSAKEQQSKSSASVYLYQFSSEVKGAQNFPSDLSIPGASHGADLPYLFEMALPMITLPPLDDDSMEVSKKMLKMWINFAKNGNPTPQPDSFLGVTWSPVTKTELNYLNIEKKLTMHRDLMKENMDFWDKILVSLE
jgi:carboxylesterase type B